MTEYPLVRPNSELLAADLRAALDLIVARSAVEGRIDGLVEGRPDLVGHLMRYGMHQMLGPSTLITLSSTPEEIRAMIGEQRPERVITLVRGSMAELLNRVRVTPSSLQPDLPLQEWHSRGFRLEGSWGVQGVASIIWAIAERVAGRIRRDDLGDRFRIAMMQSLVTTSFLPSLATIRVREYRRLP